MYMYGMMYIYGLHCVWTCSPRPHGLDTPTHLSPLNNNTIYTGFSCHMWVGGGVGGGYKA